MQQVHLQCCGVEFLRVGSTTRGVVVSDDVLHREVNRYGGGDLGISEAFGRWKVESFPTWRVIGRLRTGGPGVCGSYFLFLSHSVPFSGSHVPGCYTIVPSSAHVHVYLYVALTCQ